MNPKPNFCVEIKGSV